MHSNVALILSDKINTRDGYQFTIKNEVRFMCKYYTLLNRYGYDPNFDLSRYIPQSFEFNYDG